jgi:hypothetical protein
MPSPATVPTVDGDVGTTASERSTMTRIDDASAGGVRRGAEGDR